MKLLCCFFWLLLLTSCDYKKESVDFNEDSDDIVFNGIFVKTFTNLDENIECNAYSMTKTEISEFICNYDNSYIVFSNTGGEDVQYKGGTLTNENGKLVFEIDVEVSEEIYYTNIILSYNKTQEWFILEEQVSTKYTFEGTSYYEIEHADETILFRINAYEKENIEGEQLHE